MSNPPGQPGKGDLPFQLFRSIAMWMTHLAAGISLLAVMLYVVPSFFDTAAAKEWRMPVPTVMVVNESRWFVNYLWMLSPFVAIFDLVLLLVLNILGGRWRLLAGLWHNVLLVGVLLNITFAYASTEIVYRAYLNPEGIFIPQEDVEVPADEDERR